MQKRFLPPFKHLTPKTQFWLVTSPFWLLLLYILSFGVMEGMVYQYYNTYYVADAEIPPPPAVYTFYDPLINGSVAIGWDPVLRAFLNGCYELGRVLSPGYWWGWEEPYGLPTAVGEPVP